MILDEYALIPDIFDATSYTNNSLPPVCLAYLKDLLLNEALVRDLRNGEWSDFINSSRDRWHRAGIELFMKLVKQNRLYSCPPENAGTCEDAETWFKEAAASNNTAPLTGIVCPDELAKIHKKDGPVGSIEKLTGASWWGSRSNSARTPRTIAAYLDILSPVLLNANSLMFIDAYLDPSQRRYSEFVKLLELSSQQRVKPKIEIHRACYTGSGPQRTFIKNDEWEHTFNYHLGRRLNTLGMNTDVFIWDDFHERYLISDLVGVHVGNGFDTSNSSGAVVPWLRLSRNDRDDIQREFDPNGHRHNLRHRFTIGKSS